MDSLFYVKWWGYDQWLYKFDISVKWKVKSFFIMAERKALNGSHGSPPTTGAARLVTASVSAIHEAPKKTSSAWRRLVLLVSFCLACASSSAKHLSLSQQLLASLASRSLEGAGEAAYSKVPRGAIGPQWKRGREKWVVSRWPRIYSLWRSEAVEHTSYMCEQFSGIKFYLQLHSINNN